MTRLVFELHDLFHGHIRRQRRVGLDEAGFMVLDGLDHGGLGLGGLRAVDERHTALGGKGDTHVDTGDGLHDGGNHRDVQGDGGFLSPLETRQRRFERNVVRNAFRRRVAGYEQILRKRV